MKHSIFRWLIVSAGLGLLAPIVWFLLQRFVGANSQLAYSSVAVSQKEEGQTTRITRSNEYASCEFAPTNLWSKNQTIGARSPSPAETMSHRKIECFMS